MIKNGVLGNCIDLVSVIEDTGSTEHSNIGVSYNNVVSLFLMYLNYSLF